MHYAIASDRSLIPVNEWLPHCTVQPKLSCILSHRRKRGAFQEAFEHSSKPISSMCAREVIKICQVLKWNGLFLTPYTPSSKLKNVTINMCANLLRRNIEGDCAEINLAVGVDARDDEEDTRALQMRMRS